MDAGDPDGDEPGAPPPPLALIEASSGARGAQVHPRGTTSGAQLDASRVEGSEALSVRRGNSECVLADPVRLTCKIAWAHFEARRRMFAPPPPGTAAQGQCAPPSRFGRRSVVGMHPRGESIAGGAP